MRDPILKMTEKNRVTREAKNKLKKIIKRRHYLERP